MGMPLPSSALMMHDTKSHGRNQLISGIEELKNGYRHRLDKFCGLTSDGGAPAPTADIVNKAIDNFDGVEGLEGKGDMPDRLDTTNCWSFATILD